MIFSFIHASQIFITEHDILNDQDVIFFMVIMMLDITCIYEKLYDRCKEKLWFKFIIVCIIQ